MPTGLLLGGLLASLLVALICRLFNRVGASRRARRARRAIAPRIAAVADELVLQPLAAELGTHGELAERLGEARAAKGRGRGRLQPAIRGAGEIARLR